MVFRRGGVKVAIEITRPRIAAFGLLRGLAVSRGDSRGEQRVKLLAHFLISRPLIEHRKMLPVKRLGRDAVEPGEIIRIGAAASQIQTPVIERVQVRLAGQFQDAGGNRFNHHFINVPLGPVLVIILVRGQRRHFGGFRGRVSGESGGGDECQDGGAQCEGDFLHNFFLSVIERDGFSPLSYHC